MQYSSVQTQSRGKLLAVLKPPRGRGGSDATRCSMIRGIAASYLAFLDMVLGWLERFAPALEERYPALPDGPVVFQIRFPNIEAFSRHDVELAQVPLAPAVVVENGEIVIDCTPDYLRSFLSPGNVGDRLIISSLARSVNLLCAKEDVSDRAMKEWIGSWLGPRAPDSLR